MAVFVCFYTAKFYRTVTKTADHVQSDFFRCIIAYFVQFAVHRQSYVFVLNLIFWI